MNKPNEGWGWPDESRKAHYFNGGRSLCGKWMYVGRLPLEKGNNNSPDNCKACRKKLLVITIKSDGSIVVS